MSKDLEFLWFNSRGKPVAAGSKDYDPAWTALWWSLQLESQCPPLEKLDIVFLTAEAMVVLALPLCGPGAVNAAMAHNLYMASLALVGSFPTFRQVLEIHKRLPEPTAGLFAIAKAVSLTFNGWCNWVEGRFEPGRYEYEKSKDGAVRLIGVSHDWRGPQDARRKRIAAMYELLQFHYQTPLDRTGDPLAALRAAYDGRLKGNASRVLSWPEFLRHAAATAGVEDASDPNEMRQVLLMLLAGIHGKERELYIDQDLRVGPNWAKAISDYLAPIRREIGNKHLHAVRVDERDLVDSESPVDALTKVSEVQAVRILNDLRIRAEAQGKPFAVAWLHLHGRYEYPDRLPQNLSVSALAREHDLERQKVVDALGELIDELKILLQGAA